MAGHAANQLYAHLTWHTWNRVGCIDESIARHVRRVMEGASRRTGIRLLAMAVLADHVHVLVSYTPHDRLSDFVRLAKCGSALEVNRLVAGTLKWCRGFYAASLHRRDLERVEAYIARQYWHHPDRIPQRRRGPVTS